MTAAMTATMTATASPRLLRAPYQMAFFVVACACAGLIASAVNTRADEPPAVMLVIDGSGSMWGRITSDHPAKIDIVRDKLLGILSQSTTARVGMTSFGHRRRADCSDVEVIATPDADREPVISALKKLNPRGKGPLTFALKDAVQRLGDSRTASVIVVSDGVDNCQQDTCAAAAEIAATFPHLKIHTIAIALDPWVAPRVSCIAKATGGTYFDAATPEALDAALIEASRRAALIPTETAPVAAAPAHDTETPSPTRDTTLNASIALAEGGPPIADIAHWRVYEAGTAKLLAENEAATLSAKLEPGRYDIAARIAGIEARRTIDVPAQTDTRIVMPLDAARLKLSVADVPDGVPSGTAVVTVTADEDKSATRIVPGANAEMILPAAKYTISTIDGPARHSDTIELPAGAEKSVQVALGVGRLSLSLAGDGIAPAIFTVSEDDPDSPNGRRDIARSAAANPSFALPPGTYYVTATSGDSEVRERIAVGAGDAITRKIAIPLAPLRVSLNVAGAPADATTGVLYAVTALGSSEREVLRAVGPTLKAELPPGRYRVTARLTGYKLETSAEVAIAADKPAELPLNIAAATVSLRLAPSQHPPAGELHWEISDATGIPVWYGTGEKAEALIAPGRYTVSMAARDTAQQADFEVAADEKKVIELGGN